MTKRLLIMICSLWLLVAAGVEQMMADTVYYVHLRDGSIHAFPAALLKGAPEVSDGGTLSLTLTDGRTMTYEQSRYADCTTELPELPRLTSFKFNNKYNPALHRDVEAREESLLGDTLHLTLNAIGKRLVPSFKTDGVEVTVQADGEQVFSKESRLRFDHPIPFTVVGRGNVQLVRNDKEELVFAPLGRTLTVYTDWLTDNPNGVPRIDIRIDNNATVTSKNTYLHATFQITGNGTYDDMPKHDVWIKGRGNTSWGWPKKPYRLKFDEKVKPFGLTAGRSWVLLSNYQTGSLFANALALYSGQMVDAVACNHIVPVELYVNGDYKGNYMFTEKVGFGNNSVDGDEEIGYMVELSVEYDATYKFRTTAYNLPVNIKEPGFDEWTTSRRNERIEDIKTDFNRFTDAVAGRTDEIEELLDVDACARFMLVNDLNMNRESNHPKSTFLFKEDLGDIDSKIIFGPLWDFDWCYGYPTAYTYFENMQREEWVNANWDLVGSHFFGDLKMLGIIQRYYYRVWTNFIEADGVKQLQEFVQDYYDFAHVSFERDSQRWSKSISYPQLVTKAKKWLSTRADYIYSHLTPYDLTQFDTAVEGDVNHDGEVTVTDAYLTFCYVMGERPEELDVDRADVNYDKSVDMADVVCIVRRILSRERGAASTNRLRTPASSVSLLAEDFEIGAGETTGVTVGLADDADEATTVHALQLDVRLPEGLVLAAATLGDEVAGYTLSVQQIEDGVTRLVLLPTSSDITLAVPCPALLQLTLAAEGTVAMGERKAWLSHGRVTEADGEEKRLASLQIGFEETTGLDTAVPTLSIEGGRLLTITTLEETDVDVMTVGGICVQHLHLTPGEMRVELPDGVYIVGGTKVVICR